MRFIIKDIENDRIFGFAMELRIERPMYKKDCNNNLEEKVRTIWSHLICKRKLNLQPNQSLVRQKILCYGSQRSEIHLIHRKIMQSLQLAINKEAIEWEAFDRSSDDPIFREQCFFQRKKAQIIENKMVVGGISCCQWSSWGKKMGGNRLCIRLIRSDLSSLLRL